jgi:hypothetical protein
LAVMQAEMNALAKAEKPDQNAIQAKQKEASALREQLQEKMSDFRGKITKIAPEMQFMGRGAPPPHGNLGAGPGPGSEAAPAPPPAAKP